MDATRRAIIGLAVLCAAAIGCPTPTPTPTPTPDPDPVAGFDCERPPSLSGVVSVDDPIPDEYIVVLEPDRRAGARSQSTLRSIATQMGARDFEVFETALEGFSYRADQAGALQMASDPRVAFVQQVGRKRVSPRPAQQVGATWGLDRTDQRDLPLDGVFEPGNSGSGVHAYVLDTGLDVDHPEFTGRVGEGFSATGDGIADDDGHGTHVAGTLGGTEFGIAKEVVLHPVRVLVNGSGSDATVIRGVEFVTRHVQENGWPAVANMSLGGSISPALDMAICNSIRAGVSYAVAAGNENSDACQGSPSRIVQALGTAASNRSDERASFSNRGPCVDIFAPGRDITSARRGGGSIAFSGTSMASPHVAGVAALCLARIPGATPAQTRDCVLGHGTPDRLTAIGAGSPNLLLFAREEPLTLGLSSERP